jgi:hypothetical protein
MQKGLPASGILLVLDNLKIGMIYGKRKINGCKMIVNGFIIISNN